MTGLTSTAGPEIAGKHLELLKEATRAFGWLGVQLQVLEARGSDQFEPAFAAMARERADALLAVEDSMFWLHRRRFAELEAKYRLPTMHSVREYVEAGSLMAYGPVSQICSDAPPSI